MLELIADALNEIRLKKPLVQTITNYVTINDCANILLAFGASPAMIEAKEEAADFAKLVSSLYINLGTLTNEQYDAALEAARSAAGAGIPVVLDPVACGCVARKSELCKNLLENRYITAVKGNIGEIKALAGFGGKTRGVDSSDSGENALQACKYLADKYSVIAAATGKTDIVTDGRRTCLIKNGSSLFTLITGAGCMAGALAAGAVGAVEDKFIAVSCALAAMSLAGEHAQKLLKKPAPGSFRVILIDCIYTLTRESILEEGKIECI
jgi:hydroxyethylthiazole kinase